MGIAERQAYKGKDIVKANDIPRRTSNATAAMFKNCKRKTDVSIVALEVIPRGSRVHTPSYQRVKAEDELTQMKSLAQPIPQSTCDSRLYIK
jgi:3D (Asp-Asp-Asp) domain-containing protein